MAKIRNNKILTYNDYFYFRNNLLISKINISVSCNNL